MRAHLHRWLPTALALLALLVALGSLGAPAEAAKKLLNGAKIKPGTVASKQLADGGVASADLAAGSVTGAKVADGSLTGADVAPESLTGANLKPGSVGTDQVADGGITSAKLGPNAVQGNDMDASGFTDLNFGSINANACSNLTINVAAANIQDASLLDDVVLANPGTSFGNNFSYSVRATSATAIEVRVCNESANAGDPDGNGSGRTWRFVAIDVD
jgi:hypothetical protein